jgi:hypothetical protein
MAVVREWTKAEPEVADSEAAKPVTEVAVPSGLGCGWARSKDR